MKRIISLFALVLMGSLLSYGISPYLKVADLNNSIPGARDQVIEALTGNGYEIIGQYVPGNNPDLYVLVFTNDKIKSLCKQAKGRGMLAAAMKVGFQKKDGRIAVSILNLEYH
jgi:hypothetical protein